MIIPSKLSVGDTVALLSSSSPVSKDNQVLISQAVNLLNGMGLNVRDLSKVDIEHPYLAGSDAHRARAIQESYTDPEIKALLFTRGGYGSARLFRFLDSSALRAHRKIVLGYSDVTSLLLYFQKVCGMVVYHGPNLATPRMFDSETSTLSVDSLFSELFDAGLLREHTLSVIQAGATEGVMVGGNLTHLCCSLGTSYEIDTRQRILFLEDTGKPAYQIDRMITHLRNAGKLDNILGVVFANMHGCDNDGTLQEVLRDLFAEFAVPILYGLPSGHGPTCITVPLGLPSRIYEEGRLRIGI